MERAVSSLYHKWCSSGSVFEVGLSWSVNIYVSQAERERMVLDIKVKLQV
jgi:hypothetical protein